MLSINERFFKDVFKYICSINWMKTELIEFNFISQNTQFQFQFGSMK